MLVMALMLGTVAAALSCDKFAFSDFPKSHAGMTNPGAFHVAGLKDIIPVTVYASE